MSVTSRVLTLVMMLALVGTAVGGPAAAEPQDGTRATSGAVTKSDKKADKKAEDRYTPPAGLTLNDPLNKQRAPRAIFNQIRASIESARKPSVIRIVTWNFSSSTLRKRLIAAHQRGVAVRLIMQKNMADAQGPNGDFRVLKRALGNDNGRPKVAKNSWAKTCNGSCRGTGGIVHTKMYLFSEVGNADNVVMVSSGNTTGFAATVQWNDNYTLKNDPAAFTFFKKIFNEMPLDRRADKPYRTFRVDPNVKAIIFPFVQKKLSKDPILKRLRPVECKGATTDSGRTVIRIAQTAILDDRGEAIARRLKKLYNDGCDVMILYAVAKNRVLNVLRDRGGRGPIPTREITQDIDGDGVYDRYLHLKVLTINGVYGKNKNAYMTWNGSENWTKVPLNSDEAGFEIRKPEVLKEYKTYINRLYKNPPRNARLSARVDLSKIDPYAKVQIH